MMDEILAEKDRVQQQLAREADYDIPTMSKNAHEAVRRIEQQYHLKFKYAEVQGGYLEPAVPSPPA